MTVVAIIIGAAVGAPLRYTIDRWVHGRTAGTGDTTGGRGRWRLVPWGLFTVNVAGSGIAGLVLATTSGDLRILLLSGFCGAFTTFSGFGWDASLLWSAARTQFWVTVIGMPVACIAAFMAVWHLASATGR
jgi:CrcB protein